MDLNRLPNDQKLDLCRNYFKVGCALLPFVWLVNAVWFFKEAFLKPAYEQQKQIRKYVILSSIGTIIWGALIITWAVMFQLHRVSWGSVGDSLSFIIPMGRA